MSVVLRLKSLRCTFLVYLLFVALNGWSLIEYFLNFFRKKRKSTDNDSDDTTQAEPVSLSIWTKFASLC